MTDLKENLENIISQKTNFSKLNYKITVDIETPENTEQFPNQDFSIKKINIITIDEEIKSFTKLNQEIKELCTEIERINSAYFINFIFKECVLRIYNENINFDWHIFFNECTINVNVQDISLDEIYLLSKNFYKCTFENLSLLSNVNIVHIDLNFNDILLFQLAKIHIKDNGINKVNIRNCHIKKINIVESILERDFTIYESKIDVIKVRDTDFGILSEFNEVTFRKEFHFTEVTYKGFALFDKCTFNTKAEFEYIIFENFTSFRKTTFNKGLDLDFTSISNDNEINFFGIKGLEKEDSKKDTSQETYRIIKHNLEKIGNKIDANKYHALEIDRKRKYLESNKWENIKDYIVFKVHHISSKNSTDWVIALGWIFIVGFITILFVNFDIAKELFFHPDSFKIEYIDKIFDQLFKFIYIGYIDNELKENSLIFLSNKVLLGYLYYQFLTSIRKDTRK